MSRESDRPTPAMFPTSCVLLVLAVLSSVWALPTDRQLAPNVTLDNGEFIGSQSGEVSMFLGIPFAQRKSFS